MNCKFTILDPLFKSYMGKDEFENYDDLQTHFILALSKGVFPMNGKYVSIEQEDKGYLIGNKVLVEDIESLMSTYFTNIESTEDSKRLVEGMLEEFGTNPDPDNYKLLSSLTQLHRDIDPELLKPLHNYIPEPEETAETDETKSYYKYDPIGYAYTLNQVYSTEDLIEDVNSGEPLNQTDDLSRIRGELAKVIPDDTIFKIERDNNKNVQSGTYNGEYGFVLVPYQRVGGQLKRLYIKKDKKGWTTDENKAAKIGDSNRITFLFPDFGNGSEAYNIINKDVLPLLIQATNRELLKKYQTTNPAFFNQEYPLKGKLTTPPLAPMRKGIKRGIILTKFLSTLKGYELRIQTFTDKVSGIYAGNLYLQIGPYSIRTSRTSLSPEYQQRVKDLVGHTYSPEEAIEVAKYLNLMMDFSGGDIFFKAFGTKIKALAKSAKSGSDIVRLEKPKTLDAAGLNTVLGYARINVHKEWVAKTGVVGTQYKIENGLVKSDLTAKEAEEFYLEHHKTPLRLIQTKDGPQYYEHAQLLIDLTLPTKVTLEGEDPIVLGFSVPYTGQELSRPLEDFISEEGFTTLFNQYSDPESREVISALTLLLENETVKERLKGITVRYSTQVETGFFNRSTREIVFNPTLPIDRQVSVFAHELIHALTVDYIQQNPDSDIVQRMQGLINEYRDQLDSYNTPEELVAAISNPDMARKFKAIKVEKKNLLEKIGDFIKEIFSQIFPTTPNNLYSDLIAKMITISTIKVDPKPSGTVVEKHGRKFTKSNEDQDIFSYEGNTELKDYLSNDENKTFAQQVTKSLDAELADYVSSKGLLDKFLEGGFNFDKTFNILRDKLIDGFDLIPTLTANQTKFYDFVLADENRELVKNIWKSQTEFIKIKKGKDKDIEQEEVIIPNDTENEEQESQDSQDSQVSEMKQATEDGEETTNRIVEYERKGTETNLIENTDKVSRMFVKMLPKIEREGREPKVYSQEEIEEIVENNPYYSNDFIPVEGGFYRKFRNIFDKLELCDYYVTWNNTSLALSDSLSLEEMLEKINPKTLRVTPELAIFKSRVSGPITNRSQATLRSKLEASFKRFKLPVYVLIEDSEGNLLPRNEGADIFARVTDMIHTNFYKNVRTVLKDYIVIRNQQLFFDFKRYLKDQKVFSEDWSSIQSNPDYLRNLGFLLSQETLNSEEYKNFATAFTQMLETIPATFNMPFEIVNVLGNKDRILGTSRDADALNKYSFFRKLYTKEDQINPILPAVMVRNAENENQSILSLPNSILQDCKLINETNSLVALKEKLPRLRNPIFERSIARKALFTDKGEPKGKKVTVINYSGLKKQESEAQSKGNTSINLEDNDKMKFDFIMLLKTGFTEDTRAETASMSLAYHLDWGRTNSTQTSPFTFDAITSIILPDGSIKLGGSILDQYLDYVIGDLESAKRSLTDRNEQRYFTKFIPYDLRKTLIQGNIESNVRENKELITSYLEQVFNEEYNNAKNMFESLVGWENVEGDSWMSKKLEQVSSSPTQAKNILLAYYAINSFTTHLEETIMFHGDLSRFGKFFKRAKSIQSTGVPQSNSPALLEHINKELEENSFGLVDGNLFVIGDTYQSSVMKDDEQAYPEQENIEQGYSQSIKDYYEELGIEPNADEIARGLGLIQNPNKGYPKANIGDGDGFIHPDFYKSLLFHTGNWPQEREDVYQGLIEDYKKSLGKTYDQAKIDKGEQLMLEGKGILPKIKVTYRGNGNNDELEIMDKFALFPLFPQFVSDKPMANKLYQELGKGIGYVKFESGTKLDPGPVLNFVQEINKGNMDISFDPISLDSDKLREQIQTPEKAKKENTFGSQMRALIIAGLRIGGRYIKLKGEERAGDTMKLWENSINRMSEQIKSELMKDFGIEKKNGAWDYDGFNNEKALKRLERELNKRDIPNNIKDFFSKVKDRGSYFEESMGRAEIEKMVSSLVKSIGVQKVNGAQLIQVSSSIFMKTRLKFYEYRDGIVTPAETMVTMTGSFKNLFNLPEMKAVIEEGDSLLTKTKKLNKLLEDQTFVDKHRDKLTVVAYRIPTQGLNSMDALLIREFLPPFNEMTIVTPPEITVKSGTDYDYDKMSVLLPNLDEDGNLITKGVKGTQNTLLRAAKTILLDPINFARLITPNSDGLVMDLLKGPEGILAKTGATLTEPTGYNILTLRSNYLKWKAVKGKNLLGIVAIANKFYSLMQNHNWKVNKVFKQTFETEGKGINREVTSTVNPVLLSQKHRDKIVGEQIDLSYPVNEDGVFKQEVLSQLINVTVDMPSDDSFGFTNFKRTNLGAAIYMSNTFGYSLKSIFEFFHQPVIAKYMDRVLKLKNETFDGKKNSDTRAKVMALCEVFGLKVYPAEAKFEEDTPDGPQMKIVLYPAVDAQRLFNLIGIPIPEDLEKKNRKGEVVGYDPVKLYRVEAELTEWFNELEKEIDPTLMSGAITPNFNGANIGNQQKAILAHYFKTLQQAEVTRVANTVLNFDTNIDNNLMKVYDRFEAYDELIEYGLYPKENIDSIAGDSVISSLNTSSIMKSFSTKLFPILYAENAIKVFRLIGEKNKLSSNKDTVYRKVTNDYLHSILQNFAMYKGKTILDYARPYIKGDKVFNIITKAEELIKQFEEEGIQLRLLNILAIDKGKTATNTKLFQGFENGTDDKNQLTDEFRYLLNRPDTQEFARALAIVGLVQSGYTKSPIYFSDIIPEEFLTPIMSEAFREFQKLSPNRQLRYNFNFADNFIQYESKLLGLGAGLREGWRYKDYSMTPESYMVDEAVELISSKVASVVYNQLSTKTKSGNVKIVSWKELENPIFYITDDKNLVSTRIPHSPIHFGNPFSSDEKILKNNPKLIKTSSTKESVEKYIDWILNGAMINEKEVEPERREFILKNLKSGDLKNIPILYYKEIGEPSHANALDYLINKYNWNNAINIEQKLPDTQSQVETIQEQVEVKEGVDFVFEQNPELSNIGTEQQYSQYLDTIFPDSKVKEIVYHGSPNYFEQFDKSKLGTYTKAASAKEGMFFASSKEVSKSYLNKRGKTLQVDDYIKQKYGNIKTLLEKSIAFTGTIRFTVKGNGYEDTFYEVFSVLNNGTVIGYSETGDNYIIGNINTQEFVSNVNSTDDLSIDTIKNSINKSNKKDADLYEKYIKRNKELSSTFDNSYGGYIDKNSDITDTPFENLFIRTVIIDLKNPLVTSDKGEEYREETYFERIKKAKEENKDSVIIEDTYDSKFQTKPETVYVAFEPEQIHILGSTQDIEGFKDWMSTQPKTQDDFLSFANSLQEEIEQKPITPIAKSGKTIVVPEGANHSNLPIFETEDKIFLMNNGQQEAYNTVKTFLLQKLNSNDRYSVEETMIFTDPLNKEFSGIIPKQMWDNMIGIKGQGGVGKTSVLNKIITDVQEEYLRTNKYGSVNVTYAAPTHNAVTMLQEALGIDSESTGIVKTTAALVLRNQTKGSELAEPGKPDEELLLLKKEKYEDSLEKGYVKPISAANIIVVDEASMLDTKFIQDLLFRFKSEVPSKMPIFIFMGDFRQLPPITGERDSSFKEGIISATLFSDTTSNKSSELTQIMRSDNQLFFDIFNSVGDQIAEQRKDINAGKEPKRFEWKKYDELTSKSSRNLLVAQEKQVKALISDYAQVLANTNNPYEMFWVHYNKLTNPRTQELFNQIRKEYFTLIGKPVPKEDEIAEGDYVESVLALPIETMSDSERKITQGTVKPRARVKILSLENKSTSIRKMVTVSALKYLLPDVDVKSQTMTFFNRQGKIRMIRTLEPDAISVGKYDKVSKSQIVTITDNEGEKHEVKIPYNIWVQNKETILSLTTSLNKMFRPSYIGSSHTVQGASIKKIIAGDYNVRINAPNINFRDMESSLYVMLTRTSEKLIIIKPNNIPIENNQSEFVLQESPSQTLPATESPEDNLPCAPIPF